MTIDEDLLARSQKYLIEKSSLDQNQIDNPSADKELEDLSDTLEALIEALDKPKGKKKVIPIKVK